MSLKDTIRNAILFFLTLEARAVLHRRKPKVMVVTGSVGKTSTKDAAFTALKSTVFVRKSEKSFNSDIGVPLTILGLPNGWSNMFIWMQNLMKGFLLIFAGTPYPSWLIIEVGADRPGDISRSLAWVKPDVVITTRFPEVPVHVEFYDSPEAVAEEELFPLSLLASRGVAIMNYGDARSMAYPLPENVTRLTYGIEKDADVRGTRYRFTSKKGMVTGISFDVSYNEEKAHVNLAGVVGQGHMSAVLAGIAGAVATGVSLADAASAFTHHVTPPGRLRVLQGAGESVLIDDTYNASPVATEEALRTLKDAPVSGKRIAVLGDMFELGKFSIQEHARIGRLTYEATDIVVTVGVRARTIAETARDSGMPESRVHIFENSESAIQFLTSFVGAGDTVLIKGSQGMRMEKITKALMAHPEEAETMLPRQDAEWLIR
jgi:UDP-N-acetylmuramoyl-tripeptide--D-alanyl-D-alanine ligase